jgi:WD40 repeat protein
MILATACVCLAPLAARADTDPHGDPLPAGATARLGTVRLRHPGELLALAFSPDGKTLATAGTDKLIRFWDLASGKELGQCKGHTEAVSALLFADEGKTLISGGPDGTIRFWNVAERKQTRASEEGSAGVITALALTVDGKTLFSADRDGTVHVWDAATLNQTARHVDDAKVEGNWVVTLAPDGSTFATHQPAGRVVCLKETARGKEFLRLARYQNRVESVAFSPDGKTLATGGAEWPVCLWDVKTGELLSSIKDPAHPVRVLAFSRDGKRLAGAGGDRAVFVWEVPSGKEIQRIEAPPNSVRALAFAPDGKVLGAICFDQTVRLWDMAADRELHANRRHHGPVISARFSADGTSVITSASDRTVRFWEAKTGKELGRDNWPSVQTARLDLSDNGRAAIAVGSGESTLLDLKDNQVRERLRIKGHDAVPICSALSSDGKTAVLIDRIFVMRVWDATTGKERCLIPGIHKRIDALALSPDSSLLASSGPNEPIRLYETVTGKLRGAFGSQSGMTKLIFSPDGRMLLSLDEQARVWEVAAGQERVRLDNPPLATTAAFSADGGLLALGTALGPVHLYATATGAEVGRLSGHRGAVLTVAFSPDGKALVSAGADTTALVWDVSEARKKARPAAVALRAQEVAEKWKMLAEVNALQAHQTIVSLSAAPEPTVPFLKEKLQVLAKLDEKLLAQWIAELDHDEFDVRQNATENVASLGEAAESALVKALKNKPSLEARRRIELLLERLKAVGPDGKGLRVLRAVEVLERIGTAEAKEVLEAVAKGLPDAPQTRAAKASLERLAGRGTS